jgi:hypothetical protein
MLAWASVLVYRRRGGFRLGFGAGKRGGGPVVALYQRLLKRCERRGMVRAPSQTPQEFAVALASQKFPGVEVVIEVTNVYYRSRFGGQPIDPSQLARLEQKLDSVGRSG